MNSATPTALSSAFHFSHSPRQSDRGGGTVRHTTESFLHRRNPTQRLQPAIRQAAVILPVTTAIILQPRSQRDSSNAQNRQCFGPDIHQTYLCAGCQQDLAHPAPWLRGVLRSNRQDLRKAERRWRKLNKSCNPTTCPLDPIPSALFQSLSEDLLPFITFLINKSLASGEVPSTFKTARVLPILKKPMLNSSDVNNHRPNQLQDPNQSGFKPAHSTETALIAVTENLQSAIQIVICHPS
ncbi:uncharacterized protein LOC119264423 [Pygocentrus nattereri]|uniref:uncharacterized protein LOC119264423 n=1 Tax=Pygocentrus nattereri TaxID=42514 RepID=UPI0018910D50|nr:uncharacterized protein LOC119264423 [Pygocentrus nattereri]